MRSLSTILFIQWIFGETASVLLLVLLDLYLPCAGNDGAKAVAQLLKQNFTIRMILLDNNEITSSGGTAIGMSSSVLAGRFVCVAEHYRILLRFLCSIIHVLLFLCCVADAIAANKSLTALSLRNNLVGEVVGANLLRAVTDSAVQQVRSCLSCLNYSAVLDVDDVCQYALFLCSFLSKHKLTHCGSLISPTRV